VYVQVTAGGEALTLTARASTPDDLGLNWTQPTAVTVDVGVTAITLTDEQLKGAVLFLRDPGTHAGRTDLVFPQRVGLYAIDNATYGAGTGGGNIALITANVSNTPLNVDAGTAGWFWCNGVDVLALSVVPTPVLTGAITCTSLDAGAGTIETTGAVNGGSIGYTGAGAFEITSGSGTGMSVQTDPSAPLGFFGATPVAQPAAPVTLGDVIAALKALGLVAT
jgi:hypothetical protein